MKSIHVLFDFSSGAPYNKAMFRIFAGPYTSIRHVFIGTHSVIAINASNASGTQVTCIFNEGSLAIGCLIVLTSTVKEITYCIAQQRDFNYSANDFPVFYACKAILFDAGRYLLDVYDIERDGRISTSPAVKDEIIIEKSIAAVTELSVSRMPFRAVTCSTIHLYSFFLIALMNFPASTDGGNRNVIQITSVHAFIH